MMCRYRIAFVFALLHLFAGQVHAYTTSFGVPNTFVDPIGWDIGDPNSTYQEWNAKTVDLLPMGQEDNPPDVGYNTAGATLSTPQHRAVFPGFGPTGTSNFYAFSGNFGAEADIYNHGGVGGGTHVIVQIGTTTNSAIDPNTGEFYDYVEDHTELVPGHGFGVFWGTLQIVDPNDAPITGGANGQSLQIAEVSYAEGFSSPFGPVNYQELIYEFWLPGYTGDFLIEWEEIVHTTIDTLRVDTMIASDAFPLTNVSIPGDFDDDGDVDGVDLAQWEGDYGINGESDADGDNDSDGLDFLVWQRNYTGSLPPSITAVPEPGSFFIAMLVVVMGLLVRPR